MKQDFEESKFGELCGDVNVNILFFSCQILTISNVRVVVLQTMLQKHVYIHTHIYYYIIIIIYNILLYNINIIVFHILIIFYTFNH